MKTKLVYVLTCAPEATYIEQALMSVYSVRYYNQDAHIVLMVDDKTDALLIGKRGEILNYISEKIIIPFTDESLTPMYRSRWIKTQVRQLIKGDFMFVDCDTITQRSLADIDTFDCEVGAVLESHLPVNEFCESLHQKANEYNETIGVDIDTEKYYFSSGVLFVRETKNTHRLYELWHQYWLEGNEKGVRIDQPSLAKANRDVSHIIKQIPDTYNCILFTRPAFIRDAHILHIAAHKNPSFLFTKRVLDYVQKNGVRDAWLQKMILNPCATMMPFDYSLKHSTFMERRLWKQELTEAWRGYGNVIDATYADFPMSSRFRKFVIQLLQKWHVSLGIRCWLLERRLHISRRPVKINECQK